MYRFIGSSSICGNQISLYRLNRTGLTVYTIHSDSTIVNGYFVLFLVILSNTKVVPTEALDTEYSRKDDGLPHTHILFYRNLSLSFTPQWSISYSRAVKTILTRAFSTTWRIAALPRERMPGRMWTTPGIVLSIILILSFTLEVAGIEGFLRILPIYLDVCFTPLCKTLAHPLSSPDRERLHYGGALHQRRRRGRGRRVQRDGIRAEHVLRDHVAPVSPSPLRR